MTEGRLAFRDLIRGLRQLQLPPGSPVLVHSSIDLVEKAQGGGESIIGALLTSFQTVLMPAFSLRVMLIPEVGPENNALLYGSGGEKNLEVEFFRPDLPVDLDLGPIAELLRRDRRSRRSIHPLLSFSGTNAKPFLEAQTIQEPLGIIGALEKAGGWVLLMDLDHTANISIHWAERLAGRRQFLRWALTPRGVVECPSFPGCSQGFNALAARLEGLTRTIEIGKVSIQAVPIAETIAISRAWIEADPYALLCENSTCLFCRAVERDNGVDFVKK